MRDAWFVALRESAGWEACKWFLACIIAALAVYGVVVTGLSQ